MRRFFVLILFLLALCGSMAKNAMVEEQEVASLERQLSGKKHKMKVIRRMIATAPAKKKIKLVKEEKGLMLDCKKLKEKIERTKAKLTRLSLKYKNECIKKMISKIKKSEQKLKVQKIKLKKLKQKIILMKKTLKVAPPKSKPRLIRKLKKAVDVFVKIKIDIKNTKIKKKKAKAVLMKAKEKKIQGKAKKSQKKLKKIKTKIIKTKKEIITTKVKVKQLVKLLKKTDKVQKVKKLTAAIKKGKAKLKKLKQVSKKLQKVYKVAKVEAKKHVQVLVSHKKKKRCSQLTEKLAKELKKATTLKKKFEKEVIKADGTKKKADIKKAIKAKKDIKVVEKKIAKIKQAIKKASSKDKKKLIKQVIKLQKVLKEKKKLLIKLNKKVQKVAKLCKNAHGLAKKKYQKKRDDLESEIGKIKKTIEEYKKKKALIASIIGNDCEKKLKEEERKSKEAIEASKNKLAIAHKEAKMLKKSLHSFKKAAELEHKGLKLKLEGLAAKSDQKKAALAYKRGEILAKAHELKAISEANRKKADNYRKMMQLKTQAQLEKEKTKALKKQKKVEIKIKHITDEIDSLKKGIAEATDASVKEALQAQLNKEEKLLKEYRDNLKAAENTIISLEMEKKIHEDNLDQLKKQAALKALILEKQLAASQAKLKKGFFAKHKKNLKKKEADEEKIQKDTVLKIENKIKRLRSEYLAFKITLRRTHEKRTKILVDAKIAKYKAKIKKLKAALAKAEAEYTEGKKKVDLEVLGNLNKLEKEGLAEIKRKISFYENKIKMVNLETIEKIKAEIKKMNRILAIKKESTDRRIAQLRKELADFKAAKEKDSAELKQKIGKHESETENLKNEISNERAALITATKELEKWMATEKSHLQDNLKIKKKVTDKRVKDIDAAIKKSSAETLKKKAELETSLKAVLKEIEEYKKQMKLEKKNRDDLGLALKKAKHTAAKKKRQIAIDGMNERKGLTIKFNKRIEKCYAKVKKLQLEAVTLHEKITTTFETINEWRITEDKGRKIREKIIEYRDTARKLEEVLKENTKTFNDECSKNPNTEICVKTSDAIAGTNAQLKTINELIEAKNNELTKL